MTTRNFNVKNGLTVGTATIDAATGNANVGNLEASQIFATANITTPQLISNIADGTAPFIVTSTTRVANLNVATAGSANTAGTVTTNAQPNITSVGTLTGLTISGVTNLGPVGNVIITGGTSGYYLQTNGSGNLSWVAVPGASGQFIANGTSNVSIPAASGNVNTYVGGNATAQFVVAATGVNVAGYANIVGNANIGNLGTNTAIITTGNITTINSGLMQNGNSNVTITANGNVILNAVGGARITATSAGANVTGTLGVSGNANVLNLGTAQLLATANVIAPQLISNIAVGTAPLVVTSNTRVANLNVANAGFADAATNAAAVQSNTSTNNTVYLVGTSTAGNANVSLEKVTGITANFAANSITATSFVGALAKGTSNVNIPTANGSVNISASGNANIAVVTGTGVNVAGTLNATGNANVANLGTAGSIAATGNITGGNLISNGVLTVNGTGISSIFGNLNMNSKFVNNVSDPVLAQDVATKAYVDNMVSSGLTFHAPVRVEAPTALNATYNNGTAGVGATLTNAGANAALVIDGISVNVADRVLVYNQANPAHNGVYVVTTVGSGSVAWVLTRADDADSYAAGSPTALDEGAYFFVQEGVTGAGESYVCSTIGVITFGTTPITFSQFSKVQVYTAGTGLSLLNNEFSISNTAVTAGSYGNGDRVATFTVNEQGQLTAASNTVITANAANLSGTTLKSTVVNSSLTSVGTLTSLNVSGNANVGNIGSTNGIFTGNVTAGNANVTGQLISTIANGTAPLVVTSNTRVANLNVAYANVADFINVSAPGTGTGYLVFANATTGNVAEWTSSGITSNLANNSITATTFVGALSGTATSATTAGTVTTAAQPNITSVGTLTGLTVGNATANTIFGNGTITSTGLANVGSLNVQVTANLGNVGNITITGGTSGYYLQTNGAGALTWAAVPTGTGISNGTSNVSIPAASGNVNTSVGGNANVFVVAGTGVNVAGTLNATGNANVLNLGTGTAIITTGNITTINSGLMQNGNSNVTIASNGNISLFVTGNATARLVATSSGVNVAGTLNATGNANVLNLGAAAGVFTANVTAGNVYANSGTVGASLLTGTLTTAAQPNITSVGTLTSLTVSGNTTSGNVRVSGGLTSSRANVAVSGATVIDEFAPSTYRTAKYVISASGDNGYQSVETLLVHDGVSAYITIYGSISSNVSSEIIDVTANINGVSGNVSLYATNIGANVKVNVVSSYIQI